MEGGTNRVDEMCTELGISKRESLLDVSTLEIRKHPTN